MIRRAASQWLGQAGAAIAPFALAVGIGAVILALTGHEPVSVYRLMIRKRSAANGALRPR
jgi:hypothetical protein